MKNVTSIIRNKALRARRTRARISRGDGVRPRLSVAKSNRHLYVQIIDDTAGKTLVGIHDSAVAKKGTKRMEVAFALGQAIAKKAQEGKVTQVVFDRGQHRYHGIVKAVADGAREAGLQF